ncbi:Hsp20/alpha crystallin family protein [Synechococcus sp. CS-1331]|uniref:Hsp20/alpha crystallin family protein n=1 Tax=Synechococcus sp. CS-1331 TaxID=2847973 RepID=UPI00223BFEFD|nr:Hsp20/alpha crystallin family protein [Synechococcus sp. CS-1331]
MRFCWRKRGGPDRPSCNSRLLTATVRSHGNFIRSFTLPNNVDSQHLKAHFHDGLLEVDIPKTPETQSSSITVPVD